MFVLVWTGRLRGKSSAKVMMKVCEASSGNLASMIRSLLRFALVCMHSETRLLHTLKGNAKRCTLSEVHFVQNAIFFAGGTGPTYKRT